MPDPTSVTHAQVRAAYDALGLDGDQFALLKALVIANGLVQVFTFPPDVVPGEWREAKDGDVAFYRQDIRIVPEGATDD